MHKNLMLGAKLTRVNNAAAAGTSDITTGTWLDMEGFDSVTFIALFGAIVSGAVTGLVVKAANASDGTGAVDLVGPTVTVGDTQDNMAFAVEVTNLHGYRYVQLHIDRATQNATLDGVIALQYSSRESPVVHDATTVGDVIVAISPQPTTTGLTESTTTYGAIRVSKTYRSDS